jgi:polyisoprenyl-phosphate glycosyltransferase
MSVSKPPLTLDVVVPIYNEAEGLTYLIDALDTAFSAANLTPRNIGHTRYLFIDDGSADDSARIIADRIGAGAPAILYRLSRNFGHQHAVCAGLDFADADLVTVIDADLQDPPDVVLEMIDKVNEGYNVAFGRRRRRTETFIKRTGYWAFYRLINALSDITIPLDTGDFCVMDRNVVSALRSLPERLRFPRVLRAWVGFRQIGIEYDRPRRRAGVAKYNFRKLYRLATDGVTAASVRPLQIAQLSSFVLGLVALALTTLFVLMVMGKITALVPAPFLFTYILITSSNALTLLCLYVINAYLGRTYLEVKGRPSYIVMEVIDSHAGARQP